MTDKMTVLFVNYSKHALAAVTRNAGEGEISARDLARGGLLVRGSGDEQFEVPPEELAVVTVDRDTALLFKPRDYGIDDGQPVQLPTTTPTVTLKATDVTVSISPTTVTEETKVWVQVDGGNLAAPRVAKGAIAVGDSKTVLDIVTLDPGKYFVLTLIAGRKPDVGTQTV